MNPQQFNMGNGRGGPNNNNNNNNLNNISNNPAFVMANPMANPVTGSGMQPGMAAGTNASLQKYIIMGLHSQGQFSGWQAAVTIPERAAQVRQLVDSLRLVRPPVEPQRALDVALQFERKAFTQTNSKQDYLRECNEKLARIRDERNRQMQQGAIPNMQIQPQNIPIPQMPQNINQNIPPNMQPNMSLPQHMNPQQHAFAQQAQQNMQNQSNMMQDQNQIAQQKQQSELTPEDNKAINLRAAEMASSTPKDEMKSIVQKMNPQFCENLRAKGVEPIIYYFRMLATKEFRTKKNMKGPDVQQVNQMQNNQVMPNQHPQSFTDMGRFQGLQADGLRSQETGEDVVPASNNQPVMPGMMQRGTQMVNPNYTEQQRRLLAQQAQQTTNLQRAAALRGQAEAQVQGGIVQQGQGTPQANTPLQLLNRPVGPNIQQGVSPQPGSRPASRTPMPQQMPGQMNMQDMQKREQFLAQLPVPVQNILRQKPMSEWPTIIQQFRANNANNNMQRSASQNPQAINRTQPMQNGTFIGGANIGTPMTQSLSTGAVGHQPEQNQLQMNQEILRQRQAMQQHQQQQQHQLHLQQQMHANQAGKPLQQTQPGQQAQQGQQIRPLTSQELKFMDMQQVPPNMINNFRAHSQLPDIKNWFELKQWFINNPVPNLPMPQLMKIQANHFFYITKTRAQQNAANQNQQQQPPQQRQQPQSQTQAPPPPQSQPQAIPQQQQQRQPIQSGQMQPRQLMNSSQYKLPTQQDIQVLRAQNPQLQTVPDEHIRTMSINRQRSQMQKFLEQQAAQRNAGATNQTRQQPQLGPPPPQLPQQPQRPQAVQNQPPRKTPVQQNKSVQPPNEPVKPILVPPQIAQPDVQRLPILTKEEIMRMEPQKRQQYVAAVRKQERGRKLAELTRQVQSAAPQLRALKLDPNTRRQMQAKLMGDRVKNMMNRFDQFLHAYPDMDNNEADLRKFIQYKLELFAQYQPPSVQNKTFAPLENFSVTFERLEMMLNELSAKFTQMHQNLSKTANPQQLTPENLSRLEAQEQERKKSKGSNNAPPAPTTDRPPFQFGDAHGHGTPKYGPAGLKQEDLKLPVDAKRRKKNPPATPANNATQISATPPAPVSSPQAVKQAQPQQQYPENMFTCAVPNCEQQSKGFSSQAELDQHTNTAHKIDVNPTIDPIAFLDEALRDVFNLDENYEPIINLELRSAPMEKGLSKASLPSNFKVESKPGTPGKALNQTEATSYELPKDDNGEVLEEWKGVKINVEEWNTMFGDWEWQDVVPAAALALQDEFIANYQKSEKWQSMLRTPSLEQSTTEKSTTPPVADKEDPKVNTEQNDTLVDTTGIDGLDLSGMDVLDDFADSNGLQDVAMADEASPFEMVDKPEVTSEQQFLLDHGIDYTQPGALTTEQKNLMDFITEPISTEPEKPEYDWDIDWETVEKQYEEDIKNQVPGTWTPNGFISQPRRKA